MPENLLVNLNENKEVRSKDSYITKNIYIIGDMFGNFLIN